ncbi:MAG: methylated-DNA--[protein]-cysteine S-methyltransferase [Alphaproteobacteria bacterium]|nr:methylated-DNA--[protein]-cysteine S-methyltransferase [Alphaproteobacteria bacterium]
MRELSVNSPLGPLTVIEADGAIIELDWRRTKNEESSLLLETAADEISHYFNGSLKTFSVPLNPVGTEFQKSVWQQMCEIPYGEALSYGDVAKRLSSSPRAVGTACGRNPIPIIIPCHRIVGANGSMTGYTGAGGTKTKSFLLDLESNQAALPLVQPN